MPGFIGTPFMFDKPQTPDKDKAQPLATEHTLKRMTDILETSAIARSSESPLEKSLNSIKESTVTFNEKTMRWHDDQTNLMVKKTDPRVAEAMAPKKSAVAEMATKTKIDLPFISSQLEGIAAILSVQLNKMLEVTGQSEEDKMEAGALQENRDRDLKAHRKTIKGKWESFLKWGKESWFVKNWKLVAIGLAFLLAPLKWIKKLWGWAVAFWKMPFWGKILTLVTGYIAWQKLKSSLGKAKEFIKTSVAKRGIAGTAGHMVGKTKGALKSAGGAIKTGAVRAVEGVKAVGGKLGDMASSTKGIFGSLVKKFGSAGKWIVKLGSKLIMPLVTTPIGWAILAGLAIGALAYIFWDDLKKIWGNITGFIGATFSKVAEFASNMVGSARSMLGNFLRSVGAGMIADWIDPDGADKSKPAKEFTFKNLGVELWRAYTGVWKKIISLITDAGKAAKKIAAGFARKLGLGFIADWLTDDEEKEKDPNEVEATAAIAKTKDEKKRVKSNLAKLDKTQEEGGVLGMRDMGVDSESEKVLKDMNTTDLRMAVFGAKHLGLGKKDPALLEAMKKELAKRTMDKGDVESKIMTKDQWIASDEYKKTFKGEGASTAIQEMEYTNYVEKLRGTAGVDLSKPPKPTVAVKQPPRTDFKTSDALADYRTFKAKKSRRKTASSKKEATKNLIDMLKDMGPSELKTTVAKMNPQEITAVRVSSLFSSSGLESKHPLFKKDSGGVEMDETEGGPADAKAISAKMDKEQAAFEKGGHPAVTKLRAAQSPDDKMKTFNGAMEQNQNAKVKQSGAVSLVNTTTSQSIINKGGDGIYVQGKTVHPGKPLKTSMVK